jgi:hypothetical protein
MTRGQDSLMMNLVQDTQMTVNHLVVDNERVLKIIKASETELDEHIQYVKNLAKAGAKAW